MVVQMNNVHTSAKDDVKVLLNTEVLKGDLNITKQTLSNYAHNPSEANKTEALNFLKLVNEDILALKEKLTDPVQATLLSKVEGKFNDLNSATNKAFKEENQAEI